MVTMIIFAWNKNVAFYSIIQFDLLLCFCFLWQIYLADPFTHVLNVKHQKSILLSFIFCHIDTHSHTHKHRKINSFRIPDWRHDIQFIILRRIFIWLCKIKSEKKRTKTTEFRTKIALNSFQLTRHFIFIYFDFFSCFFFYFLSLNKFQNDEINIYTNPHTIEQLLYLTIKKNLSNACIFFSLEFEIFSVDSIVLVYRWNFDRRLYVELKKKTKWEWKNAIFGFRCQRENLDEVNSSLLELFSMLAFCVCPVYIYIVHAQFGTHTWNESRIVAIEFRCEREEKR